MIRPILLLSFFIAFTANNIAQEQQYRIWFNDKPESVHSVDEPEKFLSEQAIAHREKQNIPIDSTDLPIDPVRLKTFGTRSPYIDHIEVAEHRHHSIDRYNRLIGNRLFVVRQKARKFRNSRTTGL